MKQFLLLFLLFIFANQNDAAPNDRFMPPFDNTGAIKQDKVSINDVLTLVDHSTVLSCEPIFSSEGATKEATWYKDGVKVAHVTGQKNAIYENRSLNFSNTIPEVGFLILGKIKVEDEGDYWCLRKDTGQIGEISRIRVSHIDPIDDDVELFATPSRPFEGEMIEIECAFPSSAFPAPLVNWFFNGKVLPDRSNFIVARNASLLIYRYSAAEMGKYECVLTNFAGSTRASVTLPAPLPLPSELNSIEKQTNFDILQNGTLMFLIGCLSTICLVLIYLFGGMIWYRLSNRRPCIGQIPLWQSVLRADPALAPGFRKVIAPTPDSTQPRLLQSEEI